MSETVNGQPVQIMGQPLACKPEEGLQGPSTCPRSTSSWGRKCCSRHTRYTRTDRPACCVPPWTANTLRRPPSCSVTSALIHKTPVLTGTDKSTSQRSAICPPSNAECTTLAYKRSDGAIGTSLPSLLAPSRKLAVDAMFRQRVTGERGALESFGLLSAVLRLADFKRRNHLALSFFCRYGLMDLYCA